MTTPGGGAVFHFSTDVAEAERQIIASINNIQSRLNRGFELSGGGSSNKIEELSARLEKIQTNMARTISSLGEAAHGQVTGGQTPAAGQAFGPQALQAVREAQTETINAISAFATKSADAFRDAKVPDVASEAIRELGLSATHLIEGITSKIHVLAQGLGADPKPVLGGQYGALQVGAVTRGGVRAAEQVPDVSADDRRLAALAGRRAQAAEENVREVEAETAQRRQATGAAAAADSATLNAKQREQRAIEEAIQRKNGEYIAVSQGVAFHPETGRFLTRPPKGGESEELPRLSAAETRAREALPGALVKFAEEYNAGATQARQMAEREAHAINDNINALAQAAVERRVAENAVIRARMREASVSAMFAQIEEGEARRLGSKYIQGPGTAVRYATGPQRGEGVEDVGHLSEARTLLAAALIKDMDAIHVEANEVNRTVDVRAAAVAAKRTADEAEIEAQRRSTQTTEMFTRLQAEQARRLGSKYIQTGSEEIRYATGPQRGEQVTDVGHLTEARELLARALVQEMDVIHHEANGINDAVNARAAAAVAKQASDAALIEAQRRETQTTEMFAQLQAGQARRLGSKYIQTGADEFRYSTGAQRGESVTDVGHLTEARELLAAALTRSMDAVHHEANEINSGITARAAALVAKQAADEAEIEAQRRSTQTTEMFTRLQAGQARQLGSKYIQTGPQEIRYAAGAQRGEQVTDIGHLTEARSLLARALVAEMDVIHHEANEINSGVDARAAERVARQAAEKEALEAQRRSTQVTEMFTQLQAGQARRLGSKYIQMSGSAEDFRYATGPQRGEPVVDIGHQTEARERVQELILNAAKAEAHQINDEIDARKKTADAKKAADDKEIAARQKLAEFTQLLAEIEQGNVRELGKKYAQTGPYQFTHTTGPQRGEEVTDPGQLRDARRLLAEAMKAETAASAAKLRADQELINAQTLNAAAMRDETVAISKRLTLIPAKGTDPAQLFEKTATGHQRVDDPKRVADAEAQYAASLVKAMDAIHAAANTENDARRAAAEKALADELYAAVVRKHAAELSGGRTITKGPDPLVFERTRAGARQVTDPVDIQRAIVDLATQERILEKRRVASLQNTVVSSEEIERKYASQGGLVDQFLRGLTSASRFGTGGGGSGPINVGEAASHVAARAGSAVSYNLIYAGINQVQMGMGTLTHATLDYRDSLTNLDLAFEDSGKASMQYKDQLADLARVAGVNAGEALDIAARGARAFATAGPSGESIPNKEAGLGVAKASEQLAFLSGKGLKDVQGDVIASAQAFKLGGENATQSVDAVVAARNRFGADLGQISQGVASFAEVAQQSGLTMRQTADTVSFLVARLDDTGATAAQRTSALLSIVGGTQGQNAIAKINQSLKADQKIDTADTSINQLKQLATVYDTLSISQKDYLKNSLAGRAQSKEFVALMEGLRGAAPGQDAGVLATAFGATSSGGEAAKEMAKRLGDITGVIRQIKGDIQGLGTAIVESGLLDDIGVVVIAFEKLLHYVLELTQAFDDIPGHKFALMAAEVYLLVKAVQALRGSDLGGGGVIRRAEQVFAPSRAVARGQLEAGAPEAARKQQLEEQAKFRGSFGVATAQDVQLQAAQQRTALAEQAHAAAVEKSAVATTAAAQELAAAQAKQVSVGQLAAGELEAATAAYNAAVLEGVTEVRAAAALRVEAEKAEATATAAASAERTRIIKATDATNLGEAGRRGQGPGGNLRAEAEAAYAAGIITDPNMETIKAAKVGGKAILPGVGSGLMDAMQSAVFGGGTKPLPPGQMGPAEPRSRGEAVMEALDKVKESFSGIGDTVKETGHRVREGFTSVAASTRAAVAGLRAVGEGSVLRGGLVQGRAALNASPFAGGMGLAMGAMMGEQMIASQWARTTAQGKAVDAAHDHTTVDASGDLAKQAADAHDAARAARESSAGVAGTLTNWARMGLGAEGTGSASKQAEAAAQTAEQLQATLEGIRAAARASGGASAIDTESGDSVATSVQQLQDSGASATVIFDDLTASLDKLAGSAGGANKALDTYDQQIVAAKQGVNAGNQLQQEFENKPGWGPFKDKLSGKDRQKFQDITTDTTKDFLAGHAGPLSKEDIAQYDDLLRSKLEESMPNWDNFDDDMKQRLIDLLGANLRSEANKQRGEGKDFSSVLDAVNGELKAISQVAGASATAAVNKDLLSGDEATTGGNSGQLAIANRTLAKMTEGRDKAKVALDNAREAGNDEEMKQQQQLMDGYQDQINAQQLVVYQNMVQQAQALGEVAKNKTPFDQAAQAASAIATMEEELKSTKDYVERKVLQSRIDLAKAQQDQFNTVTLPAAQATAGQNLRDPVDMARVASENAHKALDYLNTHGGGAKERADAAAAVAQADLAYANSLLDQSDAIIESQVAAGDTVGEANAAAQKANDRANALLATQAPGADPTQRATDEQVREAQKDARKKYTDAVIAGMERVMVESQANADPRDKATDIQLRLENAQRNLSTLKAGTPGDRVGIAQAQRKVREIQLEQRRYAVDVQDAKEAAGVFKGDEVGSATADLNAAKRALDLTLKGTPEYYKALKAVQDDQMALAQAHIQAAADAALVATDVTNPLQAARVDLQQQQRLLADLRKRGAPKDVIDVQQQKTEASQANVDSLAFSQQLSAVQNAEQLGKISHAAYLKYLQGEHNRLQAKLATMKETDDEYYQMTQQLNTIDQAMKAAVSTAQGQFNLGNIQMPTVYQVRRSIIAQAQGAVDATTAAITAAQGGGGVTPLPGQQARSTDPLTAISDALAAAAGGKLDTSPGGKAITAAEALKQGQQQPSYTQNVNIQIDGADQAQIVSLLTQYLGTAAMTTMATSSRKVG